MRNKYKLAIISAAMLAAIFFVTVTEATVPEGARFWSVQSIDTMKFSRDLAREKLSDQSFDAVIETHIRNIASTGATHAAIATPYDEEFLPYLERWVSAARRHGLAVWYRGNFAGWERWFGYPAITRAEHLVKTETFILEHPFLFEDGDIFTPCTECENGGPGDPRRTGDLRGHRQFLIDEYTVTKNAFAKIGRDVRSNYLSMNGDVARLVMDQETTRLLDGIVTIDHYVKTPEQLAADVRDFVKRSGGRVVLGEFGAPIPDIHGAMSQEQQAAWLRSALEQLVQIPEVAGLNYWVSVGGSTELWAGGTTARAAVSALSEFYKPPVVTGFVTDILSRPVPEAVVSGPVRETVTSREGFFALPLPKIDGGVVRVAAPGFEGQELQVPEEDALLHVSLQRQERNWFHRLLDFLRRLFSSLFS